MNFDEPRPPPFAVFAGLPCQTCGGSILNIPEPKCIQCGRTGLPPVDASTLIRERGDTNGRQWNQRTPLWR